MSNEFENMSPAELLDALVTHRNRQGIIDALERQAETLGYQKLSQMFVVKCHNVTHSKVTEKKLSKFQEECQEYLDFILNNEKLFTDKFRYGTTDTIRFLRRMLRKNLEECPEEAEVKWGVIQDIVSEEMEEAR